MTLVYLTVKDIEDAMRVAELIAAGNTVIQPGEQNWYHEEEAVALQKEGQESENRNADSARVSVLDVDSSSKVQDRCDEKMFKESEEQDAVIVKFGKNIHALDECKKELVETPEDPSDAAVDAKDGDEKELEKSVEQDAATVMVVEKMVDHHALVEGKIELVETPKDPSGAVADAKYGDEKEAVESE